MAEWHKDSKRKPTGGLISRGRKARKFEAGNEPIKTVIGEMKAKTVKTTGGNTKIKLRASDVANVSDAKAKTVKKAKILQVIENKANAHFVRQSVITKGALLKTDAGVARVTSRPGQNGIVNAVLVEENKQ